MELLEDGLQVLHVDRPVYDVFLLVLSGAIKFPSDGIHKDTGLTKAYM